VFGQKIHNEHELVNATSPKHVSLSSPRDWEWRGKEKGDGGDGEKKEERKGRVRKKKRKRKKIEKVNYLVF
jgi:hypothetical protein